MSAVFSGTVQGSFTSTGAAQILQIREGIDWINVYNTTALAAASSTKLGVQYYWQFGMPQNSMIRYSASNAANAVNLTEFITSGGFSIVNNTINIPSAQVAITSVTNAAPPVVTTGGALGSTAGLSAGSIVQLYNVAGAQQLGGIPFTVGSVITNTSFTLANMIAIVAGTTGFYRILPYDAYFYPPTRIITNITAGASASPALSPNVTVITFSVTHAFTVGQVIRFTIPTVTALAFGTVGAFLNNVQATIIAINQPDSLGYTNTITVAINTTGYTWAWPLTAGPTFTPAQVTPVGENMAQAILSGTNQIGDSEVNQGYLGISLTGGASQPGGANADVIYWVAGKSFSGGL